MGHPSLFSGNEVKKRYRAKNKKQGLCRDCSEPICKESKIRCKKHLKSNREAYQKWRKK